MINSVRARILAAIKTGILAAGGGVGVRVGKVIMPGEVAQDAATHLKGGKFVVEIMVGDDVPTDPDRPTVESASFPVGLIIHIPDGEQPSLSRSEVAADINGDLYLVYAASDAAGTWGGLALKTDWQGFGDVYPSDAGTTVTVQGFDVTYRFTRGDPTVPR